MSIKKNWDFICNCVRCQDVTELGTYFSAIKCHSCSEISNSAQDGLDNDAKIYTSNGCYLPKNTKDLESSWSCNKCGEEKSIFEIEHILSSLEEILDEIKLKISAVKEKNPSKLPKFVKKSFDVLYQYLHSNHFLIFHYKIWIIELDISSKVNRYITTEEEKFLDENVREAIIDTIPLSEIQLEYNKDVIALVEILDPGSSICIAHHLQHQAQTRILLSSLKKQIDLESYKNIEHLTEIEKAFSESRKASMHFDYPEKRASCHVDIMTAKTE